MSDEPKSAPGWHLTPGQRVQVVQGRNLIQPPTEADAATVAANMRAMTATGSKSTIEGIPMDVLMTLEALRQLAEQGNLAAKWLWEQERIKFGISSVAVEA